MPLKKYEPILDSQTVVQMYKKKCVFINFKVLKIWNH